MLSFTTSAVHRLDNGLMQITPRQHTAGLKLLCWEFWFFGVKQARAACLFGAPRNDVLLILALLI